MSYSIKNLVLGMVETNTYLVTNLQTKKAVVIDPAEYTESLENAVKQAGADHIAYIFITHRHFDHLLGAYDLKRLTGAKIVIPELEAEALTDETISRAPGMQKFVKPDILIKDGDEIDLDGLKFKFIQTPGHTAGGCCILMEDVIFSGDTLFAGTVGRTDLPTGSYTQILQSVRKLAALPQNYRVLPGHGEETTLDRERKYNPYMGDRNDYDSLY